MTPVTHPDPAASAHQRVPARQTGTGAWRAALFASGLQPSDAPTAAMAAQAVTATVWRSGIGGCVSQMAQEFGDHPDAAADRMRWICQLATELPARPQIAAAAGRASSTAGKRSKPATTTTAQRPDSGARPERRRAAQRRERRHEPDV